MHTHSAGGVILKLVWSGYVSVDGKIMRGQKEEIRERDDLSRISPPHPLLPPDLAGPPWMPDTFFVFCF